ncbi:JAB domain-containing protein [bacterium]|nr:MAG: JAB domain-containing protein [bacterium]
MHYSVDDIPISLQTVKELPSEEQPREKLMQFGAEYLTDAELLAILIRTGSKSRNVLDTSRFILQKSNNLEGLFKKSWKELSTIPGIGSVKAVTLEAAFELSRRIQRSGSKIKQQMNSPEAIGERYISKLRDLTYEAFIVVTLDSQLRIISEKQLTAGNLSGTTIDIQRIVKEALFDSARSVVVIHNHPGGNQNPSQADKVITKRIHQALKLFEIDLIDHLIIAGNSYVSLSSLGLMDF